MKYLKRFNESGNDKSKANSEISLLLNSFGVPTDKFRINSDGSVDVIGDVKILRDLEDLPFKFGNIEGVLTIVTEHIKNWSFMPETAKKYRITKGILENNFWKKYYEIVTWEIDKYEEFANKGYNTSQNKILSDYYLEMAANNGILVQYSKEADDLIWEDAKGEFFDRSSLSLQDYPFFAQYEDIDFNQVIKLAKEKDSVSCKTLIGIALNDDGFYRDKFEEVYLANIYDQIRTIGIGKVLKYNSRELQKLVELVYMNLQKDERTNQRDKDKDCYVFLARDGFREDEKGNYKKFLDIENMFKIDIYDSTSYQTINSMLLRSKFNSDSKLWMIWLPKDFFSSEENRVNPNDYQLELINKYKEKI